MSVDEALLRAFNGWASLPPIAQLAAALSSRWVLAIVVAALLGVYRRARLRLWIVALIAVGASDLVASALVKPAVGRVRPCRALEGLEAPSSCGPGLSFPSSHAANAAALVAATAPTIGPHAAWLVPLALLVSLSRLVLGAHYPSDVLGGWLIGGLVGLAVSRALRGPRTPLAPDPSSPSGSAPPSP